ncbi:hypothetical protein ABW21_db0209268 [Orbilia brochopaga]|nr:hypothetical protein ABW21_db0209268 [Drechslerella brochopaga]
MATMSEEIRKLAESLGTPRRETSSGPAFSTHRKEDPNEIFDIQNALDGTESISRKWSKEDQFDGQLLIFTVCVKKLGRNIDTTFGQMQKIEQKLQAERDVLLDLERNLKVIRGKLVKSRRMAGKHAEKIQDAMSLLEDTVYAGREILAYDKRKQDRLSID